MNKKILFSLTSVILTVLLLSTVVFAWFSMNIQTPTSGVKIETDKNLQIYHINIYKYDNNLETGIQVNENDLNALTMSEYDSIFIQNNNNTSIIIVVSLFSQKIINGESLSVTVNCNNASTDFNILSNIINFDIGVIPEATISYNETPANIYSKANNYFSLNSNKQNFLTRNNNQLTKTRVLNFSVTNYLNYLHDSYLRLFIKIDYDENLIHYFSDNDAYINAELSNTVVLISDLVNITIE